METYQCPYPGCEWSVEFTHTRLGIAIRDDEISRHREVHTKDEVSKLAE